MQVPLICSHTRTGTHYLASLLYRNLECGVDDYEKLHYSHSRIAPKPFVHLYRPLLPVMLSIWRVRQHLGIHQDVTFSQLIRTRWDVMPRAVAGLGVFNGDRDDRICLTKAEPLETLPERWLRVTRMFQSAAAFSVTYESCVSRPLAVIEAVKKRFQLQLRSTRLDLCLDRVGWWSPVKEQPTILYDDASLLEDFQCLLG